MSVVELEIKPLKKKDFSKAIQFAIEGMHFDRYMTDETVLNLYGRYFWYMEMNRSTHLIAAYYGEELAGVLLADMDGEKKAHYSFWRNLYVKFVDWIQRMFFKEGVGPYNQANKEMLRSFSKQYQLDGEICFLAANPDIKGKGIGSLLLAELERRESGKRIYLFTDNNCTYQFYEHRGFDRVREKEVSLDFADGNTVSLSCYLYSKVCGEK